MQAYVAEIGLGRHIQAALSLVVESQSTRRAACYTSLAGPPDVHGFDKHLNFCCRSNPIAAQQW